MTPYAKLKSLADAEQCLKPGATFTLLDAAASTETDLDAAQRVTAERREFFEHIDANLTTPADRTAVR